MNLRLSLLKTLKVEGLEIFDEKAMVFYSKSFMEEYKEEEEEEDSCIEGSQFPEILGFAKSVEAEDMMKVEED